MLLGSRRATAAGSPRDCRAVAIVASSVKRGAFRRQRKGAELRRLAADAVRDVAAGNAK